MEAPKWSGLLLVVGTNKKEAGYSIASRKNN
jgi:hypothetical protein